MILRLKPTGDLIKVKKNYNNTVIGYEIDEEYNAVYIERETDSKKIKVRKEIVTDINMTTNHKDGQLNKMVLDYVCGINNEIDITIYLKAEPIVISMLLTQAKKEWNRSIERIQNSNGKEETFQFDDFVQSVSQKLLTSACFYLSE